jgi:hypothetical protein
MVISSFAVKDWQRSGSRFLISGEGRSAALHEFRCNTSSDQRSAELQVSDDSVREHCSLGTYCRPVIRWYAVCRACTGPQYQMLQLLNSGLYLILLENYIDLSIFCQ